MGLLAPLFLLGALAIALPIWLHRLQTQSSDRQPFSSAMLLETTEVQVPRCRRLGKVSPALQESKGGPEQVSAQTTLDELGGVKKVLR